MKDEFAILFVIQPTELRLGEKLCPNLELE
jgi:hypothetical protein